MKYFFEWKPQGSPTDQGYLKRQKAHDEEDWSFIPFHPITAYNCQHCLCSIRKSGSFLFSLSTPHPSLHILLRYPHRVPAKRQTIPEICLPVYRPTNDNECQPVSRCELICHLCFALAAVPGVMSPLVVVVVVVLPSCLVAAPLRTS